MRVLRFKDEAAWIEAVRADFLAALGAARKDGRVLELVLSGGSTPEPLYKALAASPVRSQPIRLWLGDERAVALADPARNGALVARCFSRAEWEPAPEIRPWPTGDAAETAPRYAAELRAVLGPRPVFDLALLGFGIDGHTASLFPGDPPSLEALIPGREEIAFATRAPVEPRARMSLGADCLAGTRLLRFVSRGKAKGEVLDRLERDEGRNLPARLVAELAASRGADVVFLHLDSE